MRHVSVSSNIADRGTEAPRATGRPGVSYPEVDGGMPVDRTICPRCFGIEGEAHRCTVCHGQPVCPGCRNARLVSVPGERVGYDVCPLCCDRLTNGDGAVDRFATGAPRWLWYPARQRAAVADYQARRREIPRSSAPARDPWNEEAAS